MVAAAAQIGYSTCKYVASPGRWDVFDYSVVVFGDTTGLLLTVGFVLGLFPQVFHSQALTLVGRARVARDFYDGRAVERPKKAMELEMEARFGRGDVGPPSVEPLGTRGERVWAHVSALLLYAGFVVPGFFAAALGFVAGTFYWLRHRPGPASDAFGEVELLIGVSALVLGAAVGYCSWWSRV